MVPAPKQFPRFVYSMPGKTLTKCTSLLETSQEPRSEGRSWLRRAADLPAGTRPAQHHNSSVSSECLMVMTPASILNVAAAVCTTAITSTGSKGGSAMTTTMTTTSTSAPSPLLGYAWCHNNCYTAQVLPFLLFDSEHPPLRSRPGCMCACSGSCAKRAAASNSDVPTAVTSSTNTT